MRLCCVWSCAKTQLIKQTGSQEKRPENLISFSNMKLLREFLVWSISAHSFLGNMLFKVVLGYIFYIWAGPSETCLMSYANNKGADQPAHPETPKDRFFHDKAHLKYEPPRDKTNKMACAPSEDSDQPRHPPSLIRVFPVHSWVAKDPSFLHADSEALIRLGGCPGWSESSLSAYAILLFVTRWLILVDFVKGLPLINRFQLK